MAYEVDIGVGVLEDVYGFDCPKCGQLGVNSCCGGVDRHESWCNYATGN